MEKTIHNFSGTVRPVFNDNPSVLKIEGNYKQYCRGELEIMIKKHLTELPFLSIKTIGARVIISGIEKLVAEKS